MDAQHGRTSRVAAFEENRRSSPNACEGYGTLDNEQSKMLQTHRPELQGANVEDTNGKQMDIEEDDQRGAHQPSEAAHLRDPSPTFQPYGNQEGTGRMPIPRGYSQRLSASVLGHRRQTAGTDVDNARYAGLRRRCTLHEHTDETSKLQQYKSTSPER